MSKRLLWVSLPSTAWSSTRHTSFRFAQAILSQNFTSIKTPKSARKSRLERIKNEHIKEIMGVEEKPDIIDIIEKKRLQ
jgi:hypothetical protein